LLVDSSPAKIRLNQVEAVFGVHKGGDRPLCAD
jgi:hypothetical protein